MKSFLLLGSLLTLASNFAYSASDNAQALQTVESAISIAHQSDLDFGTAVQGDAQLTVDPDSVETASNASFLVTGEPNKAYTITLPSDGDVVMITNGGATTDEQISVNSFTSSPSGGGMLDGSGQEELFVGATREALHPTQLSGDYSDSFTVTVVY